MEQKYYKTNINFIYQSDNKGDNKAYKEFNELFDINEISEKERLQKISDSVSRYINEASLFDDIS